MSESWKSTDLFSGKEAYVPNPQGPSEWWSDGWDDCMSGRAKRNKIGYSDEEYREYEEGYEAAERD